MAVSGWCASNEHLFSFVKKTNCDGGKIQVWMSYWCNGLTDNQFTFLLVIAN